MPTSEQIELWKAQITKKHFGKVVKCFTCSQMDWGIYEVTGKKPCAKGSRFLSDGYCRLQDGASVPVPRKKKRHRFRKRQSKGYNLSKEKQP